MEKEQQPDSISAVTIKPEYAASEVYSTEPPPFLLGVSPSIQAYHKPQSSAVQIAKIVAATVILCSVILGGFLLASAYVTANASCRALEQELEILSEAADRFQSPVPQPEALIQDEPIQTKRHTSGVEEAPKKTKDIDTNSIDNEGDSTSSDSSESTSDSSEEEDEEERTPIHIKLPLQLDMDDIAGAILDKNQRSKMNCIVEKKKAEEIVDHQPKTIRLPFGVNVTTNPRFERLSGERMVIICESGTMQRAQPESQDNSDEDDQEEDTVMIQPVMIPIPNTPFRTHMPQQMPPQMVQRIVMVAPPPPPPQDQMRMPMRPPMRPPMHPMETMRPPMPPMVRAPVQMQMPPQSLVVPQQEQQEQQQQSDFPPNPVLHHIIQQIIAQKIMETQRAREEQLRQMQMQQQQHRQEEQQQQQHQQQHMEPTQETPSGDEEEPRMIPQRFQMQPQILQRLPIPEEVLTQLNRLPNRNVIVAVQESSDSSEETSGPQDVRFVQEPRQSAAEMNGRQAFAPVNIPVAMMPHPEPEQERQEQQDSQEPQAAESEEVRPHYVQPRSVRSVDNPFKEAKRIKRCACDCAC